MKSLSRSIAVLAMVVATLSACGGNDSDGGSEKATQAVKSTVRPATGASVKAADYSYVAPKGWRELEPDSIPGFKFDSLARSVTVKSGFADNVNVLVIEPAPTKDLSRLEDAYVKELEDLSNATDIAVEDRVDIDGESAIHISAAQSQGKLHYLTEQYGALRGGKSYVVTFSFNTDATDAERNRIADSVLVTWAWS